MFKIVTLLLIFAAVGGVAQEIKIRGLRSSAEGSRMELEFKSVRGHYYEVWTTANLNDEWIITALLLGTDEKLTWRDSLENASSARYYKLVGRSSTEPGDADYDGLDDIYELTQVGMDPLARDPSVAVSVSPDRNAIAAGGLTTSAHQTEVSLQVTPPHNYRLSVWLTGGEGYLDGGVSDQGPAKLQSDAEVFVAGGAHASRRPLVVTTDARGVAVLKLTSSNKVNEQCVVHARLGTHPAMSGSEARSAPVTFGLGTIHVVFPSYLTRDAFASAVVHRSFNGMPLSGHKTALFVRRVQVNNQDLTAGIIRPDELSSYATIDPSQGQQITDSAGQVRASVFIRDVEGLGYVEMGAVDLQVFAD